MIPISDINPAKNVPVISRIFIIFSSLTFLFLQPKNNIDLLNYFYKYAAIPCELINNLPISANQFYNNNCSLEPDIVIFADKNILLSIFISLFLHANFLHILGNLWSFWIFGNNVEDKLGKVRFILFLIGAYINNQSDTILINLRQGSENGYKVPFGGMFRYVSCPNHLGEIIEWIGFAILTWSLPTLAFALWTVANLLPRAIEHHKWYHKNFKEYPKNRKAIIPYFL